MFKTFSAFYVILVLTSSCIESRSQNGTRLHEPGQRLARRVLPAIDKPNITTVSKESSV
jgi:hypothetical protein